MGFLRKFGLSLVSKINPLVLAVEFVYDNLIDIEPVNSNEDDFLKLISEHPNDSQPEIATPNLPRNKIVSTPKAIYKDPLAPPSIKFKIDYPTLPEPVYAPPPDITSSIPNQSYTVTKAQSLKDREFGKLLTPPIITEEQDWCVWVDPEKNFWEDLLTGMADFADYIIEVILQDLTDPLLTNACSWAIIRLPLPFLQKGLLIFGCQYIGAIGRYFLQQNKQINNFYPTGLINTGQYNTVYCEIKDIGEDYDNDFEIGKKFAEVGIPLPLFDDLEGRKVNQIQVLWKSVDPKIKSLKEINIPCTIDATEITTKQLKSIFPQTLRFGTSGIDLTVKLSTQDGWRQKFVTTCWMHKNDIPDAESMQIFIDTHYKTWLNFFSQNAKIEGKLRSKSNTDDYNIREGEYYCYKIILMGWCNPNDPDNQNPNPEDVTQWVKKQQWFINPQNPFN